MYDVAIIGGGVVGGLIARELTRYKVSVVILEKGNDVALGASKANSGIVHAGFDAKCGSLKAKLNVEGCALMPQTTSELGVTYKNNGSVVIADSAESLEIIKELYERGVKNGVPSLKLLNEKELHDMLPQVNGIAALYAPSAGIVCPYGLTVAAVGNAMDNGAVLKRNFAVTAIKKNGDGIAVCSDTDSIDARFVVNAAGVHSDDVARLVGDDYFSITPRAGEYILLDKDAGEMFSQTVFGAPSKMGKGVLVSPTVHGNMLLGPTATDIEDKENTETTQDGLAQVLDSVNHMVNNVPVFKAITSFCGLRSTPNTGDFIIEESHNFKNVLHVAGIESPGLSSSPAIAKYVAKLLENMGLVLDPNENFNPYREPMDKFSHLSNEEKNEIIKRDSRYGHIVCRCESITEGEIVNAIHTNPAAVDVDGVKRRTRSGMGRCQGGFCMPVVAEIIARELSLNIEDVTKSGGNSKILCGKTK